MADFGDKTINEISDEMEAVGGTRYLVTVPGKDGEVERLLLVAEGDDARATAKLLDMVWGEEGWVETAPVAGRNRVFEDDLYDGSDY